MRVRTGFVSNSSSSSFLVAFPEVIQDGIQLLQMLFKPEDLLHESFDLDPCKIMQIIWYSQSTGTYFQEGPPAPMSEEDRKSLHGYEPIFLGTDEEYSIDENPDNRLERDVYDEVMDETADQRRRRIISFYNKQSEEWDKKVETFIQRHNGSVFYCFTFSDNDGEIGSAMEHGDVFRNLPYVRFCKH